MTQPNPLGRPSRVERTDQSTEIRDRRAVVEQVIAMLPPAVIAEATEMIKGPDSTWVLRGDKGKHLAVFHDRNLAQFTRDAVAHLKAFSAYIEQLETEAYYARKRHRQQDQLVKDVSDELIGADHLGVQTKDGQRRVRRAVEAVYEDRRGSRFDDWDDVPTTRRPPR